MSLATEILPYVDGDGLVAPGTVAPGTLRGSDNGVMYTSELLAMNQYGSYGVNPQPYADAIARCFKEPGLLERAPGDNDQEADDDYYGLMSALRALGDSSKAYRATARDFLWYGVRHLGFYNNSGNGGWDAFLWRQGQLVAAMASASGLGWVPLFWPFYLWAAVAILFSSKAKAVNDTDSRRLSWHLIQATRSSVLTMAVAWVWYNRLYATYPGGMKGVAAIYYEKGHPFATYWVDKAP